MGFGNLLWAGTSSRRWTRYMAKRNDLREGSDLSLSYLVGSIMDGGGGSGGGGDETCVYSPLFSFLFPDMATKVAYCPFSFGILFSFLAGEFRNISNLRIVSYVLVQYRK